MKKQSAGCSTSTIFLIVLAVVVAIAVTVLAPMTQQQPQHGEPSWYTDLQKKVQHLIPLPGQQSGPTKSTPAAQQHPTGKTQLSSTFSGSCFEMAREAATQVGIDPNLYVRQINQESGCRDVTGASGEQGVAQFMPAMVASFQINPHDNWQALVAGAQLMSSYLKSHHGNWAQALACYNAGSGRVNTALSTYGNGWLSHMPVSTQNYVHNILGGQA